MNFVFSWYTILLTDSSFISPSEFAALLLLLDGATVAATDPDVRAVDVGAEDGLDDRLMAPTDAVPLTSDDPSRQSMLESSWNDERPSIMLKWKRAFPEYDDSSIKIKNANSISTILGNFNSGAVVWRLARFSGNYTASMSNTTD